MNCTNTIYFDVASKIVIHKSEESIPMTDEEIFDAVMDGWADSPYHAGDTVDHIGFSILYDAESHKYHVSATVYDADDTDLLTQTIMTNTNAFEDGQDYGASTVEASGASTSITNEHTVIDSHHYVMTTITPIVRALKSDGTYVTKNRDLTDRRITADAVYNAGFTDGYNAGLNA